MSLWPLELTGLNTLKPQATLWHTVSLDRDFAPESLDAFGVFLIFFYYVYPNFNMLAVVESHIALWSLFVVWFNCASTATFYSPVSR